MFLHFADNDWKLQSIYKQLLRSGTSISANVHEAEFAQSPSDFVSKLHIALKEALLVSSIKTTKNNNPLKK